MHRRISPLFSLAVSLILLAGSAARLPARAKPPSPTPTTMFPFVIPWDDASTGSAMDMSYLSPGPAGDEGYVVARDGHFVTAKNNQRIRFLGTNFTFDSLFPPHDEAEKVAAHLRKLGINIVRIHHHDADYGKLWDRHFPDHRHIDADARDRLDYLIYQFKRNGIYVDLNLHVSRQFTPEDGFPASVNALKDFDKRVDYYDTRMIELQKEFARDYLTHVNPYTKLAYAADPCVALIEINNENSLVDDAGTRLAGELADLPEPFRGELVGQWNDWLKARYHSDAALTKAWSAGAAPLGKSLIATPTSQWTLEHAGTSAATLVSEKNATGDPGATIDVSAIDATPWHVQAHFTGLNLAEGATYTVTFDARVDGAAPRSLTVYASVDQADWHHVGFDTKVTVGSDWKTYHCVFSGQNVVAGHSRLSFGLGNQTGTLHLRNVSLQPGVAPPTAAGGAAATLAARNIDLPLTAAAPERADWLRFLAETERSYADGMRDFLKNDLKVHANICCSQIMWGESAGLYREANMDFADGHAYWEHPQFPHKPWDGNDWYIDNKPMVAALPVNGGTLLRLAESRVAGKPYTITEYNEPAPNDYQCETVPELAAFAAAQDWDAIFLFDWGGYGANVKNDKIQSYFGIGSNPAKTAFLPAAALIFREAAVRPFSGGRVLNLPLTDELTASSLTTFWDRATAATDRNRPEGAVLITQTDLPRIRLATRDGKPTEPLQSTDSDPVKAEPANRTRLTTAARHFTVMNRDANVIVGYIGGTSWRVSGMHVDFDHFGDNFGAFTVTPLAKDGTSKLVTLVGRVENQGVVWNAAHDSVGTNWGHGPSQAEFIPVTFAFDADFKVHVWALDASGKRTHELTASRAREGFLVYRADLQFPSLWYEVSP